MLESLNTEQRCTLFCCNPLLICWCRSLPQSLIKYYNILGKREVSALCLDRFLFRSLLLSRWRHLRYLVSASFFVSHSFLIRHSAFLCNLHRWQVYEKNPNALLTIIISCLVCRYFTDVVFANSLGMLSIHVLPLDPARDPFVVRKVRWRKQKAKLRSFTVIFRFVQLKMPSCGNGKPMDIGHHLILCLSLKAIQWRKCWSEVQTYDRRHEPPRQSKLGMRVSSQNWTAKRRASSSSAER